MTYPKPTLGGGIADVTSWLIEVGERDVPERDTALYAAYSVENAEVLRQRGMTDSTLFHAAATAALEYRRGRLPLAWVADQYQIAGEEHLYALQALRALSDDDVLCVEKRPASNTVLGYIGSRRSAVLASVVCIAIARLICGDLGGPSLMVARLLGVGPARLNLWIGRPENAGMPADNLAVPLVSGEELSAKHVTPVVGAMKWDEWIEQCSLDAAEDEEAVKGVDHYIDHTELGKTLAWAVRNAGLSLHDPINDEIAHQIRKYVN